MPIYFTGGGGVPGGSDTQVQFNDGGVFGGDAGLVYNKTTDKLTLAGAIQLGNGLVSAPTLRWVNNAANTGFYGRGGETITYSGSGIDRVDFASTALRIFGDYPISFGASSGVSADLFLIRNAARTHAWRDGTNANRGDIENTWTSATVNEGFKIDWITTANVCEVGVFKGSGGGTARQADWMSPDGIVALRFQMGFGTGRAPNIGTANVNTTAVGNVDAGEDTLMTYSMPLNSFIAATKRVHITAWGTTANNINAKTVKLYFGSVILTNALTASIAGVWRIEADVVSTGTDTQDYISQLVTTGAAGAALNDVEQGTLTEDDGAAIVIKCTGEGTATDDIIQQGMIIAFGN